MAEFVLHQDIKWFMMVQSSNNDIPHIYYHDQACLFTLFTKQRFEKKYVEKENIFTGGICQKKGRK